MIGAHDLLRRARIPTGFVLGLVFILTAHPSLKSLAWGSALALVGIAVRIWAIGHLVKDAELTTAGPYAFIRHPLYLGNLFIGIGLALASDRWFLTMIFLLYFVVIYPPTMKAEEAHLQELFRDQFGTYRNQVPQFVPGWRRYSGVNSPVFHWKRYWVHREYRVALGFLAVLLILSGRMWINARWQL